MIHNPTPWEPTTFIFKGYNPYIGGLKPSFFMVLGSKGQFLISTEHRHLHQRLPPPLLLCLCHLSSHIRRSVFSCHLQVHVPSFMLMFQHAWIFGKKYTKGPLKNTVNPKDFPSLSCCKRILGELLTRQMLQV